MVGFEIVVGLIIGIGVTISQARKNNATGNNATSTPTFSGVTLGRDRISYNGQSQPIAGVSAIVEINPVGRTQKQQGFTQRKEDRRLIITGTQYQWAVKYSASGDSLARNFAARVTSAGLQAKK